MNYIEAVNKVGEIEKKYDVMSIKYKDVAIWPLLRINLVDQISGNNMRMKSSTFSAVKQVISTLFYYNPFNIFKKHKIWLFTAFERRKNIKGKKILRVSGGIIELEPSTLVVEKPSINQAQNEKNNILEKEIVSESWILLFVHAITFLSKWIKPKLENEDILKRVLHENKIMFDYYGSIRLLISQKIVFDVLLLVTSNPRKVIIECPYTIMGYVWSLHNHGIPIIELQHGVLNDKHYAYNSIYTSKLLYPDEICVFGEDEYAYLNSDNCHYCKNIHKTGLYILDLAKRSFVNDVFKKYRNDYKHIVLVSGQRGYEEVMADYIRLIAEKSSECLFVYVPRNENAGLVFVQKNVLYSPGINIYEYMIWCDLHITISSTTCLECQYYKKPTIFYNYAGMAVNYYSRVLKPENGVIYTDSADEYAKALDVVLTKTFEYKDVFAKDAIEKIKKVIMK